MQHIFCFLTQQKNRIWVLTPPQCHGYPTVLQIDLRANADTVEVRKGLQRGPCCLEISQENEKNELENWFNSVKNSEVQFDVEKCGDKLLDSHAEQIEEKGW